MRLTTFTISLALAFSALAKPVYHKKSKYLYDPNDTSCDGFPMVRVETMPGTCLGMVISAEYAKDQSTDRDFIKPRTILQVPGTQDFLVADMGGWGKSNGRLFLLKRKHRNELAPKDSNYQDNPYEIKLLAHGMENPHGLAIEPSTLPVDGATEGLVAGDSYIIYLGERDKVSRFVYTSGQTTPIQLTTVLSGLPSFDGHMHPLTQFTFDPKSFDLIINSGSPSDSCFVSDSDELGADYKTCPESDKDGMGALYRIPYDVHAWRDNTRGLRPEWLLAQGLRNSMALAIHPSSRLLVQGENSRDFPEFEEPYEEINIINLEKHTNNEGKVYHYGWPYCYNFRGTSPEWDFDGANNYGKIRERYNKPIDCRYDLEAGGNFYRAPHALMPPHAAPLHMAYYLPQNAQAAKGVLGLGKHLLVSWHGHQPTGNRLVAYPYDNTGAPQVEALTEGKPRYSVDVAGSCPKKNVFAPHGGLLRHAPYKEVISGWSAISGVRPEGAPVGFSVAEDGSIWIVEDRKNKSVLRLAKYEGNQYSDDCVPTEGEYTDPKIKLLAWRDYMLETPELFNQPVEGQIAFTGVYEKLIKTSCVGCHGNLQVDDIISEDNSTTRAHKMWRTLDFLIKNEWIIPGNKEESKLYGAIAHLQEYTPMPPADKAQLKGTDEGEQLIAQVGRWIESMSEDPNTWYKKVRLISSGNRNIRNKPSTVGSTTCGAAKGSSHDGDILYMDVRKGVVTGDSDDYYWAKLYMVPRHTRLNDNCQPHPENGAYYMATGKSREASVLKEIE